MSSVQEVSGGYLYTSSGRVPFNRQTKHATQRLALLGVAGGACGWSLDHVLSVLLTIQDISCLSYLIAALTRLWNMLQVRPADVTVGQECVTFCWQMLMAGKKHFLRVFSALNFVLRVFHCTTNHIHACNQVG